MGNLFDLGLECKKIKGKIFVFLITCICIMCLVKCDVYAADDVVAINGTVLVKDTYYKSDGAVGSASNYAYYYKDSTRNFIADYELHIKDLNLAGTITVHQTVSVILEGNNTLTGDGTGYGFDLQGGSVIFDGAGSITIQDYKYGINAPNGSVYVEDGEVTIKNVEVGIYLRKDYGHIDLEGDSAY